VVDEVEQAVIGPLEVLEDEDDDASLGDPLEEDAPRREERLAVRPIALATLHSEQLKQARLEPAPLGVIRDPLLERRGELRARCGRVVRLDDPRPAAHHLGQRPEADPLSVRRGAALVPVDDLGDAVDVLLELPDQPRLADPALPHDRNEPRPSLGRRGRVEVLEHPQLGAASDERRLELLAAPRPAPLRDDPQGAICRYWRLLALEDLLPGGLERDCAAGRVEGRFPHEYGARRGDALEPRRGVDEVSSHHALVGRAERDRRLTRQHAGPQLQVAVDVEAEPSHRLDQIERAAHRPLRIVLVRRRRSPDRHHRVADELLDRSPIPPDDVGSHLEVAAQQLADRLGVA
jgi:hypothetical protein